MARTRHMSLILGLVGLAAAVLSQPAAAATARIEVKEAAGGPVAKLIYRAAQGEANNPGVCTTVGSEALCQSSDLPGDPTAYLIETTSGAVTVPGPGCQSVSDDPLVAVQRVRCPIPEGTRMTGPLLELGDRNDQAFITSPSGALYVGAVIRGGSGPDSVQGGGLLDGGNGADVLQADNVLRRAAHLKGGPGDDAIVGGPGGDLIETGTGRDTVDAGAGADRIRAQDRQFDSIRCGRGLDRLWLNGFDLAFGPHCERIRRDGPPRAIPYDFSYDVFDPFSIYLACPTDMPTACRVLVTMTVRSGRVREVGRDRLTLNPGETGRAEIVETGPVNRRTVRLTVRTFRRDRPPISVTRRYFIEVSEGDG